MILVGQPAPSVALEQALELLAQGMNKNGEELLKKAALKAKARHGSGSHPLNQRYADLARYHFHCGNCKRAASEFEHASKGPLPPMNEERQDRLSFILGFGICLGELGQFQEAEKVLRQSLAFARNLNGGQSASAAIAMVPLSEVLLMAGNTTEAAKFAMESYDLLWRLGDPEIKLAVALRAEALKAIGRADDPFTDLNDLPEDIVSASIAHTLARSGRGKPGHIRAVLADLLGFVDKRYGDGHPLTCDTLAAIAHHEANLGSQGDEKVRRSAVRRSVWSFAVRRLPGGLLTNLQVGFEPGGTIHLAPHVARTPSPAETTQLETTLNQAIDDLYARPGTQA